MLTLQDLRDVIREEMGSIIMALGIIVDVCSELIGIYPDILDQTVFTFVLALFHGNTQRVAKSKRVIYSCKTDFFNLLSRFRVFDTEIFNSIDGKSGGHI